MKKIIEHRRKDIDLSKIDKTEVSEKDVKIFVDGEVGVYDPDVSLEEPVVCVARIDEDTTALRKHCGEIPYDCRPRASGIPTVSKIFGFRPGAPMRQNAKSCSATSLSHQDPAAHNEMMRFGKIVADIYKKQCPVSYERQLNDVKSKILSDWIIPETPFTSGIVNKNNALRYHFDKGNFDGMRSVMILLKKNIEGGNLVIPEYNVCIRIPDNCVAFFDGQSLLHGVSPIKRTRVDSYRYTLVYYSLKAMCKCKSVAEEIELANKQHYDTAKKLTTTSV